MKRIFLIMGVLVLSIGLLAACGGDDDDDDTGAAETSVGEVSTEVGGAATEAGEEMTGTEAESTGTEAEGTGTMAEGTGTEAEGTGTMAEGTGTMAEGTGTEAEGTGTEAEGTGTMGEGETYAIGDPITVSDDLTITVEGTNDSVDTSVATPEEGMTFLGVEVSIEGDVSGMMADMPSTLQNLALEDASGETYDLNMEATAEMAKNMVPDIGGDAAATGTESDATGDATGTEGEGTTITLVFEVPEDVMPSDLTLTGETEDGEMFSVPLEESSSS